MKHSGTVAACGLAGGMALQGLTVAPFILRGVTLRGIDSVYLDMSQRQSVYETYTPILLNSKKLELITAGNDQIIGLDEVAEKAKLMLSGHIKGRYVVKI